MKTIYYTIIYAIIALAFAGCAKENTVNEDVAVEGVRLNMSSVDMKKGESLRLYATVFPENAEYCETEWVSSSPETVSVDADGEVVALKAGSATITVSVLEYTASCEVTVAATTSDFIGLNLYNLSMIPGDEVRLFAEILPEDTDDKTIVWSSGDETVATVSDEGVVAAIADGKTLISAKSGDNEALCSVTVASPKPAVGDIYYSDGTFAPKLVEGKTPIGVIYWLGDPTEKDAALKAEHPECTHGMVVAITDAADGKSLMWQPEFTAFRKEFDEYKGVAGRWVDGNTDYISPVTTSSTESLARPIGYNNTKSLEKFNEALPDYAVQAVLEVTAYGKKVVAPEKSSGWYLPSILELRKLLCTDSDEIKENANYGIYNTDFINAVLKDIESSEPITGNYWSSSEHNMYTKAWAVSLTLQGRVWSQNKNYPNKVRPVLAF